MLYEKIKKLMEEVVAITDNTPVEVIGCVGTEEEKKKKKVDKENQDPDK